MVELVSSTGVLRDGFDQKELFERFGVREYWLGDPANKTLEILTLQQGRYVMHCSATERGELSSLVLPELAFDLRDIQPD